MTTIVTHTSPDWDAIGATWLLKRFLLPDAEIAFVNTGNPDQVLLSTADAVVDTGKIFDPARLRFDHHQLAGASSNATCATRQVWMELLKRNTDVIPGRYEELYTLMPLIDLIYEGDTGKSDANSSRTVGIHALLSVRKARRDSDQALSAWGFEILDDMAAHLQARATARRSLAQHTTYRSADGLVIALDGAPQGATFAAFDEGARLVVFHSEQPGTVSCGCMRGGEGDIPHIGDLIMQIFNTADLMSGETSAIFVELDRWFRHPAGFFAGRGTAKAPDARPLEVAVSIIAERIDYIWTR